MRQEHRVPSAIISFLWKRPTAMRGKLASLPGVTGVEAAETGVVVFTNGRAGLLPEIVNIAGDNLRDISVSETTLESVFIKLTGRDLRD